MWQMREWVLLLTQCPMIVGHDEFAWDEKAGWTHSWGMFFKAQIRLHVSDSKDSYMSAALNGVWTEFDSWPKTA